MTDHRSAGTKNALSLAAGLSLALLLAVLAVRCTSRSHDARQAPPGAEATHGAELSSAEPAPASNGDDAAPAVAAGVEPAARDAGAPTSLGRLMRATDTHDRDLLATIERETRGAPPASARELIELRRAGKSRAELERFIDEELGGGAPVRLAAKRWLRAIHGEPEPPRDIDVLSRPNTTEPSQRMVKPLTKKPQP